jgi:ketosteroid isomerase-like protein
MVDEPRNAASEAAEVMTELAFAREDLDEFLAMVAEDFVQRDRRKLVGSTTEVGKAEYAQIAAFFVHEAGLESRHRKVLAVRGDHLVLTRIVDRYRDGSMREFLGVEHFTGDPVQTHRAVMFDLDDLDAALAELDRLEAELHEGHA